MPQKEHNGSEGRIEIRDLLLPVYAPVILSALSWGISIPIIPLFARELGAGLSLTGLIITADGLGNLAFDLPSGIFLTKTGELKAVRLALGITAVSALCIWLFPYLLILGVLLFLQGGVRSLVFLSYQSLIKKNMPIHRRGRALSLIGGSLRIGMFIGPILGGIIGKTVSLHAVFLVQAVLVSSGFFLILLYQPKKLHVSKRTQAVPLQFWSILREHKKSFLTVGLPIVALQILRSGRRIIFPLWGEAIHLDVAQIGIIMGLSSAIDMLLFYPIGILMDRRGRKWAVMPCIILVSTGILLIPLTHSFSALLLVGLLVGLGNGFGSGIVMTLSTDLAPEKATGSFLGVFRLVADIGNAAGPSLTGWVAATAGLALAPAFLAVPGFAAALFLFFLFEETLTHRS
jgi:MFS family permease